MNLADHFEKHGFTGTEKITQVGIIAALLPFQKAEDVCRKQTYRPFSQALLWKGGSSLSLLSLFYTHWHMITHGKIIKKKENASAIIFYLFVV